MPFTKLGLNAEILHELHKAGFSQPTEIQEKTISLALQGKDIIGAAKTGSGKTLAFGLPIIQNITPEKPVQALILVPTRELAVQVSQELERFSAWKNLRVATVYGGVDIKGQISSVQYSEIIVGTPGRILDHIERRTLNLSGINFLVLDEADRMLDMGFYDDVNKIIGFCNKKRQTFLFSATISQDVDRLSHHYMHNPERVSAETYVDASLLEQFYVEVPNYEKFSLLVHFLKEENSGLVMVFCATRRSADVVGKSLEKNGIDASIIHGGFTQNQRERTLSGFKKSNTMVLVCTDVAARGLDIPNVSHVYNYDLPKTKEEYIHRIGRTARAGNEGKAISLLSDRDYDNFRAILKDGTLNIKEMPMPRLKEKAHMHHAERRGHFRSRPKHLRTRNHGRHGRNFFRSRGDFR